MRFDAYWYCICIRSRKEEPVSSTAMAPLTLLLHAGHCPIVIQFKGANEEEKVYILKANSNGDKILLNKKEY